MIFILTGLGADEKAFAYTNFDDKPHTFIPWVIPEKKESLRDYAQRLISLYEIKENDTIIGLSFGGILAQEIGSLLPSAKVILLCTVKSPAEFPPLLRAIKRSGIHRPVSGRLLKLLGGYFAPLLLGPQKSNTRKYLLSILDQMDPSFLKWSVRMIFEWKGNPKPENVIHLHGSRDVVFPILYIRDAIVIEGGGHFMVAEMPKKVNTVLNKYL